jgi:hypothetical protein
MARMRTTYNTQRPERKKQNTKWGESLTRGHIKFSLGVRGLGKKERQDGVICITNHIMIRR